jgi:nitric oxide reductase NorQ protein
MATATATKPATPRKKAAPKKAHPLAHLIPPQEVADGYVSRYFHGVRDLDCYRFADNSNYNVLVFGPTGPGKTTSIFAYAAETRKPIVTLACNGGIDPATLWGQNRRTANGQFTVEESTLTTAVREGAIIYLDEFNFMHPRAAAIFHSLLDSRREVTIPELGNETIKAHPDVFVIAAYNPDYQGTRPINQAMKNRFPVKFEFNYDPEIERQIVSLYDEVDCEPLLTLAKNLRDLHSAGDISTPVSTNMLQEFVLIGDSFGYDFAATNFVNAFDADERRSVADNLDLRSDELREMIEATQQAGEA